MPQANSTMPRAMPPNFIVRCADWGAAAINQKYKPIFPPPPVGYVVAAAIATGLARGVAYAIVREIWDDIDWDRGNINIDIDRDSKN
jgi:hypothetical protein